MTLRGGFKRRSQEIYHLPVVIEDGGLQTLSSTGTLTIRVCGCDTDGSLLTCSAEAIFLPVGLSTGALIAILVCIVILLGKQTFIHQSIRQREREGEKVRELSVQTTYTRCNPNSIWNDNAYCKVKAARTLFCKITKQTIIVSIIDF